ncbi:hypothetical protein LP419_25915 [Massilia sp. H-1]|nr:hypothetical protein LP419_25915 [Massilia sp. H-1]
MEALAQRQAPHLDQCVRQGCGRGRLRLAAPVLGPALEAVQPWQSAVGAAAGDPVRVGHRDPGAGAGPHSGRGA